jgi:hypothetical protein
MRLCAKSVPTCGFTHACSPRCCKLDKTYVGCVGGTSNVSLLHMNLMGMIRTVSILSGVVQTA